MATYDEYVSAIKKYVPVSESFTDDYFNIAINQARLEIASFFDPKIVIVNFLIDSKEIDILIKTGYSLNKILKIMSVIIKQSNLRYEIPRGFKEAIPYEKYIGYPAFYYVVGSKMGFYPDPTGLKLYAEVKLSIAPHHIKLGQADELPDIYKPLVIYLACSHVANMAGNANLSSYFRELYENRKTQVYRVAL